MKRIVTCCACVLLVAGAAKAESDDAGDLAKASQNPIGNIVSLPFQNNTSFGIGPDDAVSNVRKKAAMFNAMNPPRHSTQ